MKSQMLMAIVTVGCSLATAPAHGARLVLNPVADATLIEDAQGARANGAAPELYVGATQRDGARRGLLRFDLSALPPGAQVTAATLVLRLERTRPESLTLRLHRVETSWGEGTSNYFGGVGGPASPSSATWLHRNFGTGPLWTQAGGDHAATASASTLIGDQTVDYAISGAGMLADIATWRAQGATNHGWLLKAEGGSAKAFASRESTDAAARPRLTIDYELPAVSDADAPLPAWAALLLAVGLGAGLGRRKRP